MSTNPSTPSPCLTWFAGHQLTREKKGKKSNTSKHLEVAKISPKAEKAKPETKWFLKKKTLGPLHLASSRHFAKAYLIRSALSALREASTASMKRRCSSPTLASPAPGASGAGCSWQRTASHAAVESTWMDGFWGNREITDPYDVVKRVKQVMTDFDP